MNCYLVDDADVICFSCECRFAWISFDDLLFLIRSSINVWIQGRVVL